MPSAEGMGVARKAWDAYSRGVKRAVGPLASDIAASRVDDMIGFWVLWHMYGGFEGLRGIGFPRTTIFRKVSTFRKTFGHHPDVFIFEGIRVEPGNGATSVRLPDGTVIPVVPASMTDPQ
jgi:hypothetical protein